MPGATTFAADATMNFAHCISIRIDVEEMAHPYSAFSWLKAATIQQILDVPLPKPDLLY
ncbi:MAG: hypothetical protein ACK55X_15675 [Synechococcaceae cyanobacterium]|jgi:hypothetical protein